MSGLSVHLWHLCQKVISLTLRLRFA